ncbi:PTS system mannose/fructose/sorbose family transporter subunit IID [Collinsella sp. AGMB00827]|uniref:PTS system mannose/fructose/sorbose family transporter subunit IID n=1 Tax=Collinsella ureilytica TaxID=2869515 RepID=A0ABS7MKN1_9ACTN|nr:PTS system mannose/fructose/sorbose family transporter subunit IID [Collinsella urealyticum]MBY4797863.1 PTS system mannose/fructose/sorbose family transporter subunit IID [Collinsella urealyticum]
MTTISNELSPSLNDAGQEHKITKADLIKTSLNIGSLGMEFSWTYYKQMNIAFCLMVAKLLKKIYRDDEVGYRAALSRHMAFFNITVQFAPFVGGIALSMEERIARGEADPESVNEVKAALMGPLSGVGDAIFLSTLRVLAAGIGISLCQSGSLLGPIAFLLIYNIPGFWLRVWGIQKGYHLGVNFLEQAIKSGLMEKVMLAIGIIGAMVIGSMTVGMFWATMPIPIGGGEDPATLQSILDSIMPGLLGLGAFGLYYWLLSKKVSPTILILGTMALGVIGAYFGFLA